MSRDFDLRPEGLEGQKVRVDATTADGVTTRLGDVGRPAARQEGTGQKDRGADLLRERRVGIAGDVALGLDTHDVRLDAVDTRSDAFHDLQHDPDVLDVRQVPQEHGLVGEQTSRKDGQGGVLVAAGADRPFKSPAPLYDEAFHRRGVYRGA